MDSTLLFRFVCDCFEPSRCFTNSTPDGGDHVVIQSDMFDIKYNSYFFDNVRDAHIKRIQLGPLMLNTSFIHFFKPFSILRTESLVQIDPHYNDYKYVTYEEDGNS